MAGELKPLVNPRTWTIAAPSETPLLHALATGSLLIVALLLLSTPAFSQPSLAGVVRDSSGAVLSGVNVEAASPTLIEKSRTVVTDGTGQYRIVDLKPGTYIVTFMLSGYRTVRREVD